MRRHQRLPADFLLDPIILVALCLLLVNDHYLKANHPSAITGKLSDMAGLTLFPALVIAMAELTLRLPRPTGWTSCPSWFWVAAGATAIGFSLIKLLPVLAGVQEALNDLLTSALRWAGLLGSATIRPDATDLVALPCVLLSVWVGYRWRGRTHS